MWRLDDGINDHADEPQDAAEQSACWRDQPLRQFASPQAHENRDGCRCVQDVGQQEEADDVVVLQQAKNSKSEGESKRALMPLQEVRLNS